MKKSSRAQPCMHVAIMGEAQCMMIEASMLSANDQSDHGVTTSLYSSDFPRSNEVNVSLL